jgi:hypothetical protein
MGESTGAGAATAVAHCGGEYALFIVLTSPPLQMTPERRLEGIQASTLGAGVDLRQKRHGRRIRGYTSHAPY